MATRVTCPGCGKVLQVPAGCDAAELTCPHCLGIVPNPSAPTGAAVSAAVGAIQTTPTPGAPRTTPSCPHCGESVDPTWRWCPACGRSTKYAGLATPDLDVDVRRDHRRAGCVLASLPVLGGLGVAYLLIGGLSMGADEGFGLVLAVLLVLGVIVGVWSWCLGKKSGRPVTSRDVGHAVVGTLRVAGILVGSMVVLGFASFIVLFAICLSGGMRWH